MLEKLFETAANFWAEQLNPDLDNWCIGDGFTNMLGKVTAKTERLYITPNQLEIFKSELQEIIVEKYVNSNIDIIVTGVDYEPCEVLVRACKKSGISVSALPVKSCMRIDTKNETIEIKVGYGKFFAPLPIVKTN